MKLQHEISSISESAANMLIRAAINEANSINLKISVCILDPAGRMKAFAAMDDAPNVSYEACIKKAQTAVGFGLPTGKTWHDFIKNDPILEKGAQQLPNFILLGGGSPIVKDGRILGAIGVSGGHYEQDEKCVKAALESLNIL